MKSWPLSFRDAHTAGRRLPATGGAWIERLARIGLAAKGVVYILVGTVAAAAAFSSRSATGSEGALASLPRETVFQILLALIALGLIGYAIWRFVSALLNPERENAAHRAAHLVKGIVHGGLAVAAARFALGAGGAGDDGARATHLTAEAMAQPFGILAVAIAGATTLAYGLYQLYRSFSARLEEDLDLRNLSSGASEWIVRFGRFGLAARGVVLCVIGLFLISAARESDPGEARGMGGALRTIEQQAYGEYLLATVAIGLIAYGLFQLVRAKRRRIATPA